MKVSDYKRKFTTFNVYQIHNNVKMQNELKRSAYVKIENP